jgi:hypothetical protein
MREQYAPGEANPGTYAPFVEYIVKAVRHAGPGRIGKLSSNINSTMFSERPDINNMQTMALFFQNK